MGIKLVPYSKLPAHVRKLVLASQEDGCCMPREDGQIYIYYNDRKLWGRIRFTILHEIGHIALDHQEQSDVAEAEANFFAKYAIAPPPLVHALGIPNVYQIMERFETTDECAHYVLNYYYKWLNYGAYHYTFNESRLQALFELVEPNRFRFA
jgi:Zn-dependent peptidase ImmA (M78 family)